MDLLDPKTDLVFKLLLTREEALLIDMLEGILGRTVEALTLVDADIPGDLALDKAIILDIRAVLDDGARVDVEMQIRAPPPLRSRLIFYCARDYSGQLGRGEDYSRLTPTAVIVWMLDPLFPQLERLHSIFELRERYTHMRFSDQLAIHVLQLRSLRRSQTADADVRVQRWARFLTARSEAELDQLARESPVMSLAKQTLEEISHDPETFRRARERADALALYQIDLAASRAAGEAKGRAAGEAKGRAAGEAKGRAALLLKQLALRFGPPSEAIRARLEAATIDQLDTWAERMVTAETLTEILEP